MSDPQNYTVGWICALTTESVAAQSFFDEEHEGPSEVAPNDNNTYALGKMGKHNVVIAVMPKYEYGTTSAATVARDMLHSFPNIRTGLMVGIAGGAPSSKHDIRLGDVVVSSRSSGKGGVLPYDYGRTIQNQSFTETGVLNQPPQLLSTAVSALEGLYEMKGHKLEDAVASALGNIKKQKKYRRPPAASDRLYRSVFTHPQGSSAGCDEVCGEDTRNLIARAERDEEEDNPAIHYGLIASANTLMMDAIIRDKLAADRDVLCFEMEAAGLMNHFPCLVIRGICDYSDTHKNKDWQGFAAMMAAAYAKDLLVQISPKKVELARRMEEDLGSVKLGVASIQEKTGEVHQMLTDKQRHEISKWLEYTDPSPIHIRNHKLYEPETGMWMWRSHQWTSWLAGQVRCLWLHGAAGAGKTVLMSQLIEETKRHCELSPDHTTTWVYYYCYYGHGQDEAAPFLRWVVSQLCRRCGSVPGSVLEIYQMGTQPSLLELFSWLESILHHFSRVYILVDALDESVAPRDDLLGVMRDLATDPRFRKIHIVASSRKYIDIEKAMSEFSTPLSMSNYLVDQDIRTYVRSKLYSNPRLQKWPRDVLAEVEDTLAKKAEGMFRWAVCQIQAIQWLRPEYHIVRNELATLPKTLDETYERIFLAIDEDHRLFITHALRWIYFHVEVWKQGVSCPILLQAAGHSASHVDSNVQKYNYDEDMLREFCGSLITITRVTYKQYPAIHVAFSHYTVLEYLESSRIVTGPTSMFALDRDVVEHELLRTILGELQSHSPRPRPDFQDPPHEMSFYEDIRSWYLLTLLALLSSTPWQRKMARQAELRALVFELVRPSRPGYSSFRAAVERSWASPLTMGSVVMKHQFFDVEWYSADGCEEAAILLNLLPSRKYPLAKALIRQSNKRDLFRTQLSLRTNVSITGIHSREYFSRNEEQELSGTIVEIAAQLGGSHSTTLLFLLDHAREFFDPSAILNLCSGMWSFLTTGFLTQNLSYIDLKELWRIDNHILRELLRLGADPNLTGYRLTPLQVAAAGWDHTKARILLKYGADPTKVGSASGISWGTGSVMERYNRGLLDLYDVEPREMSGRFQGRYALAGGMFYKGRRMFEVLLEGIISGQNVVSDLELYDIRVDSDSSTDSDSSASV